ncbi:MAG: GNAT family N-acetyltransferase [bacterium]|nr:GNAT family N-acetyltransferase [bacterium]
MELIKANNNPIDVATYLDIHAPLVDSKIYSAFRETGEAGEELTNCQVYFIKKGGEVVGVISYERKNPNHIYLSDLVILSKFQGQGLARQAIEKILQEIGDVKRVDLATHPENTKAIKLYESLGFKIEGKLEKESGKDTYDNQPRIVMAKTAF